MKMVSGDKNSSARFADSSRFTGSNIAQRFEIRTCQLGGAPNKYPSDAVLRRAPDPYRQHFRQKPPSPPLQKVCISTSETANRTTEREDNPLSGNNVPVTVVENSVEFVKNTGSKESRTASSYFPLTSFLFPVFLRRRLDGSFGGRGLPFLSCFYSVSVFSFECSVSGSSLRSKSDRDGGRAFERNIKSRSYHDRILVTDPLEPEIIPTTQ